MSYYLIFKVTYIHVRLYFIIGLCSLDVLQYILLHIIQLNLNVSE